MEFIKLGRTDLTVSVAGLGCGGHSRLGQADGQSENHSVSVVHAALDAGVNFIDTAKLYHTERIVAKAIRGRRDRVVLSTKLRPTGRRLPLVGQTLMRGWQLRRQVEETLSRLNTDYLDVLHLHAVAPAQYAHCEAKLLPTLTRLRDEGKIRSIGITEKFGTDTRHQMMARAVQQPHWDVLMTGFNLINQSARGQVFAASQTSGVGVVSGFAVRRSLANEQSASELVRRLIKRGEVDAAAVNASSPFDFLLAADVADSLPEAAYRYARHEPGIDVVLTGTGSIQHLLANLEAIQKPPLPDAILRRLEQCFGRVTSVSGD